MDPTGLPIAIIVTSGSRNEQMTMVPIEKKILQGYGIQDFIICTDSGLSSEENREFNNVAGRAFITTVSIKKMSAKMMNRNEGTMIRVYFFPEKVPLRMK